MGVYSYGIVRTKNLPEIGEVSVFKFRFKRWGYFHPNAERQEKADERFLKARKGKTYPRLAVHQKSDSTTTYDELFVWVSKSAIGDDDYGYQPFSFNTLTKYFTDEEQFALTDKAPWIVYALGCHARGEIPYIPTTQKRYYELVNEGIDKRLAERARVSA